MIPGVEIDRSSTVRQRIKNLPLPARETYKLFGKMDRSRNAALVERQSEQERLRGELSEAYHDLTLFDRAHERYKLDKPEVRTRELKIERIDEIKAEMKALTTEPLPSGGYVEQIDRWLPGQPYAFRMRKTKLEQRKGLNKLELFEMTKGALLDFRKQIQTDKNLKLTQVEGTQQALADLDELAAKGEINVSGCFRLGKLDVEDRHVVQGHIKWPVIEIPNPNNHDQPHKILDFAAVYARVHYDTLKAEILKQCAKHDDPNALSREERQLREVEKRATLLDLEYQLYLRFFEARAAGFLEVRLPVGERTGDRFLDGMSGLVFNPAAALGIERDPNPDQTERRPNNEPDSFDDDDFDFD